MDELQIDDFPTVEPDGHEDEPLIADLIRFAPGCFGHVGARFKSARAVVFSKTFSLELMRYLTE